MAFNHTSRRQSERSGHSQAEASRPRPMEDLYSQVTARIIAQLEEGRLPWVQPWDSSAVLAGLPRNASSGRPYSGINILILWHALFEGEFTAQRWLTFKQAEALGGHVRKGERGVTVCYADRFTPKDGRGNDGGATGAGGGDVSASSGGGDEVRQVAFLKRFTVFNVAQCEGLEEGLGADPAPLPHCRIAPMAEEVIEASGVEVRVGGQKAFYHPAADYVQVPPQLAFHDTINWYRTALHELCHACGHKSRLGRNLANVFGSPEYAREELIAEMGSAFLCAALGIEPTVRHADYIGAWLEVLREDSRAIFRAASAASKAADWLLARHAEAEGAGLDNAATGEGRAVA